MTRKKSTGPAASGTAARCGTSARATTGHRELVAADIWVATPASLIHTAVPSQQNPERLRYLELACRRSDLIVVDEADRVQMQLDIMFAPATTLAGKAPNSWLDEVHARKIEELSRSGRTQLSDGDVRRWTAAVSSVTSATDRIYEILLMRPDIRRWVEADYFSAWTLQQKLIDEWFGPEESPGQPDAADVLDRPGPEWDDPRHDEPADQPPGDSTERSAGPSKDSGQRALVIKILDEFRDDPLGDTDKHSAEATALIQLTRHLLHATGTTNVRQPRPRAAARPVRAAGSGTRRACHQEGRGGRQAEARGADARQFEFTLLLSVLHTRLDMMTDMWPRVEAALNLVGTSNALSRRPPEDYRPLVPESPMGNILGFQFQPDSSSREPQSGELRFFRCAGSGRELLLGLPGLTAADGLPAPHVVLMSGTSWAGTSTRYHVLTEVGAILSPPQDELDAIDRTTLHHLLPQRRRRQATEALRYQAPPAPARTGADAQPARPAAPRRIGQPDAGRTRGHRRRQPQAAAPAHRQLRRGPPGGGLPGDHRALGRAGLPARLRRRGAGPPVA